MVSIEMTAGKGGEGRRLENGVIMAGARIAAAATSVLIVPRIIRALGAGGFGTWEAILGLAMMCAVGQNAISSLVLWRSAGALGSRSTGGAERAFRVGLTLVITQTVVVLSIVGALREQAVDTLNLAAAARYELSIVLPLTVAIVLMGGVNECLSAVVSGAQRAGAAAIAQLCFQVANFALAVLLLEYGFELMGMAVAMLAAHVLMFFILRATVARVAGFVPHLRLARPEPAEMRTSLAYLGPMIVGSIAILLRDSAVKVIGTATSSPEWTASYGIALRLAATIMMMLSFITLPAFAAFGAHHARGEEADVRSLFERLVTQIALLTGIVVVVVLTTGDRLVYAWVGREVPATSQMLAILSAAYALVALLTGAGSALCKGIGRTDVELRYVVASLALNVLFLVALVPVVGPVGAVVAAGMSWVVAGCYFRYELTRTLRLPTTDLPTVGVAIVAMSITVLGVGLLQTSYLPAAKTRTEALATAIPIGAGAIVTYVALFLGGRKGVREIASKGPARAVADSPYSP